jgi:hypothetical protein
MEVDTFDDKLDLDATTYISSDPLDDHVEEVSDSEESL